MSKSIPLLPLASTPIPTQDPPQTPQIPNDRRPLFPIKLTGYRILNTTVVAGFGIAKTILLVEGQSDVLTRLDVVFGLIFVGVSSRLGRFHDMEPDVLPWLFHADYSNEICTFLDRFVLIPIVYYVTFCLSFISLVPSSNFANRMLASVSGNTSIALAWVLKPLIYIFLFRSMLLGEKALVRLCLTYLVRREPIRKWAIDDILAALLGVLTGLWTIKKFLGEWTYDPILYYSLPFCYVYIYVTQEEDDEDDDEDDEDDSEYS